MAPEKCKYFHYYYYVRGKGRMKTVGGGEMQTGLQVSYGVVGELASLGMSAVYT